MHGVVRQERRVGVVLANRRRRHHAERRLVRELLARAQHGVAAQRLDGLAAIADVVRRRQSRRPRGRSTAVSAPSENPARRPVSLPAPMMVAASGAFEYSSSRGLGRPLRRAADAARVEQAGAVAVVAVHVEAEGARPFDEERPPLGEERLEGIEVDDGGVGFDLAEVGIRRGGQRQAGRDRVLHVEANRRAGIGRRVDRVGIVHVLRLDLADASTAAARTSSACPTSSGRASRRTATRSRWRCATAAASSRFRPGGPLRESRQSPPGRPVSSLKRSCENGMRNSALQPSASFTTSTSHTASQLSSLLPSLK